MASNTFSISAQPGTDIFADRFNAPRHHPSGVKCSGSLDDFVSARVTFCLNNRILDDQAGLLLSFRLKSESVKADSAPSKPAKWIKVCRTKTIEADLTQTGTPSKSKKASGMRVYSCDSNSSMVSVNAGPVGNRFPWTTLCMEKGPCRESGEDYGRDAICSSQVWVDGQKDYHESFSWPYKGGDDEGSKWEVMVEAYVARPDFGVIKAEGELEVEFKDFQVDWKTPSDG